MIWDAAAELPLQRERALLDAGFERNPGYRRLARSMRLIWIDDGIGLKPGIIPP